MPPFCPAGCGSNRGGQPGGADGGGAGGIPRGRRQPVEPCVSPPTRTNYGRWGACTASRTPCGQWKLRVRSVSEISVWISRSAFRGGRRTVCGGRWRRRWHWSRAPVGILPGPGGRGRRSGGADAQDWDCLPTRRGGGAGIGSVRAVGASAVGCRIQALRNLNYARPVCAPVTSAYVAGQALYRAWRGRVLLPARRPLRAVT